MKTRLILSLVSLIAVFISCQNDPYTLYQYGQITGTIVDGKTQKPLAGVTISTTPGSSSTITDANGSYTLTEVKVGTVTLTAIKASYTQYSAQIDVTYNKTTTASFAMDPSESTVGTVVLAKSFPDSSASSVKSIITFRWNAKRSDPIDTISYRLTVIKSGSNTEKTYYNISDTSLVVRGLDFSAKYYWYVSAVYNKKVISTSTVWPFTTIPSPESVIFFSSSALNGLSQLLATDASRDFEDTVSYSFAKTAYAPVGYKNSNKVLFTSQVNNIPYVFIMNRDGSGAMRISPHPNMSSYSAGNGYSFYNHGSSILYTYMDKLYSVNTDGTNEQLIATAPTNRHFTNVDWCPENGKIVVRTVGPMPYQSEFYTFSNDGKNQQQIMASTTGMLESPSFSPNGKYLVYTKDISGNISLDGTSIKSHIFIKDMTDATVSDVDITASNNNNTTGLNDITPRFGPDNRQIVFVNRSNLSTGNGTIYIIDIFNLERIEQGSKGLFPYWAN